MASGDIKGYNTSKKARGVPGTVYNHMANRAKNKKPEAPVRTMSQQAANKQAARAKRAK